MSFAQSKFLKKFLRAGEKHDACCWTIFGSISMPKTF